MRFSRFVSRLFFVYLAFLAAPASAVLGQTMGVSNLSLRPTGVFQFDGVDFAVVHFDPQWASVTQAKARVDAGYPRSQAKRWETHGALAASGNAGTLLIRQQVVPLDARSLRVEYNVASADSAGVPTRELALQVTLPLEIAKGRTVEIDGKPHVLQTEFRGQMVLVGESAVKTRTLVLPTATGTISISGVFGLLVQDQRRWKHDAYTVRIYFPLTAKKFRRSGLVVTMNKAPWRSVPVALRAQVNRSFHNAISGDRRGSWANPRDNELAAMTPGKLTAAGVNFDIIDPATNGGRAVLVLGKAMQNVLPQAATFSVPGRPTWRNLCLLHTGASLPAGGQPVGKVRVRYADGSRSDYEVRAKRDLGDWKMPAPLPNGAVGWTGKNATSPVVGLYVSRFVLERKPVASVSVECTSAATWIIAGVSGSPDNVVPLSLEMPLVIAPGTEWAAWKHSVEIAPGGVFDFSFLADAPAGKYGRLVATPSGHFEFAGRPGKRVRLWGVNLCFSANYLEPDEADRLAGRLAASGYNSVRFHHYDRDLVAKGKHSHGFDPNQIEKLDALFAAMKRHGLYVNIDLFTLRGFSAAEKATIGIASGNDSTAQFKALVPISEEAFTAWKTFAARLLLHRNPHTGLTWAEDPALIGICPLNEDTLTIWANCTPAIRQRYEEAFHQWWKNAANREKSGDVRETGFNLFIHERQIAADARSHAFLRSLGVKALLTGTNFLHMPALAFARSQYDYVDNHQYWDHPQFPERQWALPFAFAQGSAVRATARTPRGMMASRLWGKPYMVSEFNYVRPNRYRAEGGVLMPAYASLQDWDAVYNFEYASRRTSAANGGVTDTFAIADDPVGLLADRVGALLFRRGDISPAKHAIGYAVQTPDAFDAKGREFPETFSKLGLITRIGSGILTPENEIVKHKLTAVITAPNTACIFRADTALAQRLKRAGVLPPESFDAEGTRFVSDTGQIELLPKKGAMKVVTPRSELFVLPPEQTLEGARVRVENGETFGTLSVVSLDGKPLAECSRLLVLHLTDALPTGMRFANHDRRLLKERGREPHLVQAGEAKVWLRLASTKTWRAWTVDATGKRQREITLSRQGNALILPAKTVSKNGTCFAYELATK
ncbi:MAG: hypothetical protein LBS59_06010 [Puniceicoccales bacterium]|nr:hypothetical protein [Puniceicoccales bacterium]